MRIEFIYSYFSSGSKVFDFANLYDSNMGLTGSETNCFEFASAMQRLGYDITLYVPCKEEINWNGVQIKHLSKFGEARKPPEVVYSWNEPAPLRYTWEGSLRMVNQQLNDFYYADPNDFNCVDIFTSVSPSHLEYIKGHTLGHENKWRVINNCFNDKLISFNKNKNKGTCIWASSPDRGLHLLLSQWKKIKKYAKNSKLEIYYDFDKWFSTFENVSEDSSIQMKEISNRAKYIKYAMSKLNNLDISHYKCVSKNQISQAFMNAEVFPYSCSTVSWTEGFSCSTLEACASGAVPILSNQDSLGQIYGNVCPMVKTPLTENIEEFSDLVIKALTDEKWANKIREKCVSFAQEFTFDKESIKLDELIKNNLK